MKHYERKQLFLDSGETYAYIEAGSGNNPLLLIHGNMSSSIHWSPLIENLEDDCKIIAPDLRGFGDSSYERPFNHLDELADEVYDLCSKLGIKHTSVAGWSTGGGVAMSLAARYPGFVDMIIMVDSMSGCGYPIFKKDADRKPIFGTAYATKEEMALDPVQVAPSDFIIKSKDYASMEFIWDAVIYTAGKKPSPEDNHLLLTETFKERCLVDTDWALATFNYSDNDTLYAKGTGLAHQIACPILSIWGEKDITVPSYMATENRVLFPQLEFITLHECGHSPVNDQLDALTNYIKDALS